MGTKECVCSYQQSLRLKGLGFDWPCWCIYATSGNGRFPLRMHEAENYNTPLNVSAPTHEVAHRWLREKMRIFISITTEKSLKGIEGYGFMIIYLQNNNIVGSSYEIYKDYESAMSGAVDCAIDCAVIEYRKRNTKIK